MIEATSEPDTAAIFEADTIGLTAISARLEALENEHGKLSELFRRAEADVGAALDRWEAPLELVQKMSELDRELQDFEKKMAAELAAAIEALRDPGL